jgi:hypothetical protein
MSKDKITFENGAVITLQKNSGVEGRGVPQQDPVVDKSLGKEEDVWEAFDRVLKQFPDDALKDLHYDIGQQFHHLEVEIIDLKAQLKESKSKAIEDFILELREWCECSHGDADHAYNLLAYAESLKDKI